MQRREEVFNDDTGSIELFVYKDRDVFIEIELKQAASLSNIKHWRSTLSNLENSLKERGVDKLYCLVATQAGFDFAEFMGFQTDQVVWGNQIELMSKDLN